MHEPLWRADLARHTCRCDTLIMPLCRNSSVCVTSSLGIQAVWVLLCIFAQFGPKSSDMIYELLPINQSINQSIFILLKICLFPISSESFITLD